MLRGRKWSAVVVWKWLFILLLSFSLGWLLAYWLNPARKCSSLLVKNGQSVVFVAAGSQVMYKNGYLIVDFMRPGKQATWVGEFTSYVCEH